MEKSECIFVFVKGYYNKDPKDGETIDYRASVHMYAIDVTIGIIAIKTVLLTFATVLQTFISMLLTFETVLLTFYTMTLKR